MSIRSTVKAVIIVDKKILLNRCNDPVYGEYYSLPGGGQNQYESFYEAVKRECLEETGYSVRPVRFAALCETIFMNEEQRENDPNYTHRIYHVFLCELCSEDRVVPSEKDSMQVSCEWVDIDSISKETRLFPKAVCDNIDIILNSSTPIYLGTDYKD